LFTAELLTETSQHIFVKDEFHDMSVSSANNSVASIPSLL